MNELYFLYILYIAILYKSIMYIIIIYIEYTNIELYDEKTCTYSKKFILKKMMHHKILNDKQCSLENHY